MVKQTLLLLVLLILSTTWAVAQRGLEDPLRPLAGVPASDAEEAAKIEQKQPHELRLEAVLLSAERTVAIINGHALQVGDQIEGFRLNKIEKSRVELQKKQKKIVLRRTGTGLKKAFSSQDVGKGSRP